MDLDLFKKNADENAHVSKKFYIPYRPTSTLDVGTPLEFNIPSHGPHLISLKDCTLSLTWDVMQGSVHLSSATAAAPINLAHQTMWRQVDLTLQHSYADTSGGLYAYRSYLETLLGHGNASKDTCLTGQFWYTDDAERLNNLKTRSQLATEETAHWATVHKVPFRTTVNKGFAARQDLASGGLVNTEGPLHLDMFSQDKPLLPNIDMNLKFWPHDASFAIQQEGTADNKLSIVLKSAELKICYVALTEKALAELESRLSKSPAYYPIQKTVVKHYFIPRNSSNVSIENMYGGYVPSVFLAGLVDATAFSGNIQKNPLLFDHFNASEAAFYVDGESVPTQPLKMNFAGSDERRTEGYLSVMSILPENTYPFDMESWESGCTLYGFNIAGKKEVVKRQGKTRFEIQAGNTGTDKVLVTYAVFPGLVRITKDRKVVEE